jgi:hypothetical protein
MAFYWANGDLKGTGKNQRSYNRDINNENTSNNKPSLTKFFLLALGPQAVLCFGLYLIPKQETIQPTATTPIIQHAPAPLPAASAPSCPCK